MKTINCTTHCQICGRAIETKNGKIVRHGHLNKPCKGGNNLPFEVSSSAIVAELEKNSKLMQEKTDELVAFAANPPAKLSLNGLTLTIEFDKPEGFDAYKTYVSDGKSYGALFQRCKNSLVDQIKTAFKDKEYFQKRLAAWKPAQEAC